jgi:hypothetical protein
MEQPWISAMTIICSLVVAVASNNWTALPINDTTLVEDIYMTLAAKCASRQHDRLLHDVSLFDQQFDARLKLAKEEGRSLTHVMFATLGARGHFNPVCVVQILHIPFIAFLRSIADNPTDV